jgi:hypothetical protein
MARTTHRREVSLPLLWFSVLTGPLAWTLHLLVSYPLVPVACAADQPWLLHAVTIATELITIAAAYVGYRGWQESRSDPDTGVRGRASGYRHFLSLSGLLMSLLFILVILFEGLPAVLLSPCLG